MAISNEIEKLERRWQQTSGLVFAPLAEAYRKAGLHQRALEVLEQGLSLHPEYGPALIVRGRCHLDTGNLNLAEAAFEQALLRDPMDPIALRGMADVFARTDRVQEAIDRLQILVEIDPQNTEARAVLQRLRHQPPVTEPAESEPAPVDPAPIEPEPPPPAFPLWRAPEVPEASAPPPPQSSEAPVPETNEPVGFEPTALTAPDAEEIPIEVIDLSASEATPVTPVNPGPVVEIDDFRVESFAVEPLEVPAEPSDRTPESLGPVSWTPAPVAEPMEETETASVPESPPEPMVEMPEEPLVASFQPVLEPEIEAGVEPEPAVAEPPVGEYASAMAQPIESAAAEISPEPEAEETEKLSQPPPAEVVVGDVPVEEPPALIVTESMAELFLKQGHRELALAVYRQLVDRSPESDRLRSEIERIESELAPRATPSAASQRSYAATATGGQSVERMLQGILRAQPTAPASSVLPPAIEPTPGEPTRAASETLPLSAVFGDEPAVAPKPEPTPADTEPSFDEFFGAVPSAEPAPTGGGERSPEAEDLRQFNEWLKGLKR
ncbi:MAG TPA: tetratricopeptide repeat protein [Gemmatimonadales bacterium]